MIRAANAPVLVETPGGLKGLAADMEFVRETLNG
jgi:hypothetical protein